MQGGRGMISRGDNLRVIRVLSFGFFRAYYISNMSILYPRQLEAIVRISESLAKMRLAPFATEADVDEALRLFQVSTLDAAMSGSLAGIPVKIYKFYKLSLTIS